MLVAAHSCACSCEPGRPLLGCLTWLSAAPCMHDLGNQRACGPLPCSASHARACFCMGSAARYTRGLRRLAHGTARRQQQQRRGRPGRRCGGQRSGAAACGWDGPDGTCCLSAAAGPPGVRLIQVGVQRRRGAPSICALGAHHVLLGYLFRRRLAPNGCMCTCIAHLAPLQWPAAQAACVSWHPLACCSQPTSWLSLPVSCINAHVSLTRCISAVLTIILSTSTIFCTAHLLLSLCIACSDTHEWCCKPPARL